MGGKKRISFPSGTCRSWAGFVGLDDSLVWGVVGEERAVGLLFHPECFSVNSRDLCIQTLSMILRGRWLHCKVVSSLLSLTFKNSLFIKPPNENET